MYKCDVPDQTGANISATSIITYTEIRCILKINYYIAYIAAPSRLIIHKVLFIVLLFLFELITKFNGKHSCKCTCHEHVLVLFDSSFPV